MPKFPAARLFGSTRKRLEERAAAKLCALTHEAERLGVGSVHDLPDDVKQEHDYDGLSRDVVKLFGIPPQWR